MSKKKPLVVPAVAALVVGMAAGAFFYLQTGDEKEARKVATQFASAWTAGSFDDIDFVDVEGSDATSQYNAAVGTLAASPVKVDVRSVRAKRSTAKADLDITWSFGKNEWKYTSVLDVQDDNGWKAVWKLQSIHPDMTADDRLAASRVQPKRADVLGSNGQTLVTESPVVHVGVVPQRTTSAEELAQQLADILAVDAAPLVAQIKSAKPDAFVNVITLRQSDYDAVKDKLQPLPGTAFQRSTLPLAPTREFANALLGRVGPVTAEIIKNSNGRYVAGDVAGLSGVQQQYDDRLAGSAGTTITLVTRAANETIKQLFAVEPTPGQPVQLSIDTKTQQAADRVLASQPKPSALVAIQASTGKVLAVANGPGVVGLNNAFTGRYPPGSSFKVITTYALLQNGVKASDIVACPPTISVDGRSFKNAEDEAFGSAPFSTDFAMSCNTAFVSLAPKVASDALPNAAKVFGLGAEWNLGVPSFSGSVPRPDTPVQLAATAFGQGSTLVSPLAMANVAAQVATGTARPPVVVTDPAPAAPAAATPLDATAIATLQTLMRQVVTSGTATAAANVPGGPVHGKTGTAEFGTDDPPKSHAWFIGYQGGIAFAVFVEGGEFGGETAAPMAARFLTELTK
jgi:cell division protein FtsI/penicillin-binding protein 2